VLAAIGVGVWRQYKLRKQLEELRQDWSEQNDALHRELIELRRQLAALPSLASDAERSAKPVDSPPPASVRTENIRVAVPSSSAERVDLRVPPTQIEHSAPVAQSNIVETAQSKKPEDFASAPPVAESPAASPSSVYPSATPIPGKPPAPITTPSQPKIPPKSEPAISRTEPAPHVCPSNTLCTRATTCVCHGAISGRRANSSHFSFRTRRNTRNELVEQARDRHPCAGNRPVRNL